MNLAEYIDPHFTRMFKKAKTKIEKKPKQQIVCCFVVVVFFKAYTITTDLCPWLHTPFLLNVTEYFFMHINLYIYLSSYVSYNFNLCVPRSVPTEVIQKINTSTDLRLKVINSIHIVRLI